MKVSSSARRKHAAGEKVIVNNGIKAIWPYSLAANSMIKSVNLVGAMLLLSAILAMAVAMPIHEGMRGISAIFIFFHLFFPFDLIDLHI